LPGQANACLLKTSPLENSYTASPGLLTLVVVSTVGAVAFDPAATEVTDQNGKGPPDWKCSATRMTFTLVKGNTYHLDISFVFANPDKDTGVIKESCPAPQLNDTITSPAFTPDYTIMVS